MKLKKFGALLLTGVLAITSLTTSAFAAKREKRSADDIDFAAVLEDTSAKARSTSTTGGRLAARRMRLNPSSTNSRARTAR